MNSLCILCYLLLKRFVHASKVSTVIYTTPVSCRQLLLLRSLDRREIVI
jgi:hypothetical protein